MPHRLDFVLESLEAPGTNYRLCRIGVATRFVLAELRSSGLKPSNVSVKWLCVWCWLFRSEAKGASTTEKSKDGVMARLNSASTSRWWLQHATTSSGRLRQCHDVRRVRNTTCAATHLGPIPVDSIYDRASRGSVGWLDIAGVERRRPSDVDYSRDHSHRVVVPYHDADFWQRRAGGEQS